MDSHSTARNLLPMNEPASPASGQADPQVHVDRVLSVGYSIIENVYSAADIEDMRAELAALYDDAGRPPLYAPKSEYREPNLLVERSGAAFYSVADRRPALSTYRMKPYVFSVLQRLLGEDFVLEMSLCLLCDSSRPFLGWHNHIGGLDHDIYKELYEPEKLAAIDVPRRLNVLVYLDDSSVDTGQLLLYPKRVSPLESPFPENDPHWEGRVAATFPKGSVVLLDQGTWHAATHRPLPGLRMIFGLYVAERKAPHRVVSEGHAVPEGLLIEPVPATHPGMNPAVGMHTKPLDEEVIAPVAAKLTDACPGWQLNATRTDGRDVYFYLRSPLEQYFILSAGPVGDIAVVYASTPGIDWRYRAEELPEEDEAELNHVIPWLHEAAAPVVTGKPSTFASAADVPLVLTRAAARGSSSEAANALREWEGRSALDSLDFAGWALASANRRGEVLLLELVRRASEDSVGDVAAPVASDVETEAGAVPEKEEGRERIVVQIENAQPDQRSFCVIDGVAYSYRGSLDEAVIAELPQILKALHPPLLPLLEQERKASA